MSKTVDEYLAHLGEPGRGWVKEFVGFMRREYPVVSEGISYQIPTYKVGNTYVAFSAAKGHFTFHTIDFERLGKLREELPGIRFGKGSAKVDYENEAAKPALYACIRDILARQGATAP